MVSNVLWPIACSFRAAPMPHGVGTAAVRLHASIVPPNTEAWQEICWVRCLSPRGLPHCAQVRSLQGWSCGVVEAFPTAWRCGHTGAVPSAQLSVCCYLFTVLAVQTGGVQQPCPTMSNSTLVQRQTAKALPLVPVAPSARFTP